MRVVNVVLTGVLLLSLAIAAEAKSLRRSSGPAEVPPASYKSSQYIDSKGCVFIRAGFGGSVQWVPRVTRSRQMICGQSPSRVAGTSRPTSTRKVAPQTQVRTASAPVQTKPKPARQTWSWFGTPQRSTRQTPRVVAAPVVQQRRVAAVVPVTAPVRRQYQSSMSVRRGPQPIHPAQYARGRQAGVAVQVTRAAPAALPPGYKSLLSEPIAQRGVGTAQGQAQMDLIWTQTTPRRLIDVTTGRDVTTQLPQVRYPYTRVSTKSYVASATPAYAPVKKRRKRRPVVDEASPANMKKIEDVSALDPSVTPAVAPVVAVTPASHRYIQVATFGVPANATRTRARFSANGLPTVSRALRRSGKTYAIVMLGPFQDQAALQAALGAARGAGFSDAFYVR